MNRRNFLQLLGLAAAAPHFIKGRVLVADTPARVVYHTIEPTHFELDVIATERRDIYDFPVGRVIHGYTFRCLSPKPVAIGTQMEISAMKEVFRGYVTGISKSSDSPHYWLQGTIQNPLE